MQRLETALGLTNPAVTQFVDLWQPFWCLGAGVGEVRMVLQHPSSLREATSLCASMGGARIKERCRILTLGAEEGDQVLCTGKTEITVASKTTEAPPVFR